jgi:hypothetical protein
MAQTVDSAKNDYWIPILAIIFIAIGIVAMGIMFILKILSWPIVKLTGWGKPVIDPKNPSQLYIVERSNTHGESTGKFGPFCARHARDFKTSIVVDNDRKWAYELFQKGKIVRALDNELTCEFCR